MMPVSSSVEGGAHAKIELLLCLPARNYSFYRNGNLCKGTSFSKIILGAKSKPIRCHKKVHWFCRMSVMAKLLCFECFAAG